MQLLMAEHEKSGMQKNTLPISLQARFSALTYECIYIYIYIYTHTPHVYAHMNVGCLKLLVLFCIKEAFTLHAY